MLPVSGSELAGIQADLAAAVCDKPCTIKRATLVDDGYGTQTETLSTVANTKVGLEKPSGGLLQNYSELIASQATWLVHFPYGQDVREKDELHVLGSSLIVQEMLDLRSLPGLTDVLATEIK
jgi:hypothetical protein